MTTSTQPVHLTPAKNHRFLLLDALRGLAALFVVAFHFPHPRMVSMLLPNGMLAVDFFFCLSGFVIAFSYEKRLSEALSLKSFVIARWIRLYPVYLLGSIFGLVSAILIHHTSTTASRTPGNWFVLFGMAVFVWPARFSTVSSPVNFPLDRPSWSLFYEVVANLVYALLVKGRAVHSAVLLGISAVSFGILTASVSHGQTMGGGDATTTTALGFARVAFSFAAGILVYRLYRSTVHTASWVAFHWIAPIAVTSGLCAVLVCPLIGTHNEWFRLFAVAVCFPTLVYCGALVRLPHRLAGVSGILGQLSYPLYLLHVPFVVLLYTSHVWIWADAHPATAYAGLVATLGIFAFSAWWIDEHVDLPLRRFLTNRTNTLMGWTGPPAKVITVLERPL